MNIYLTEGNKKDRELGQSYHKQRVAAGDASAVRRLARAN